MSISDLQFWSALSYSIVVEQKEVVGAGKVVVKQRGFRRFTDYFSTFVHKDSLTEEIENAKERVREQDEDAVINGEPAVTRIGVTDFFNVNIQFQSAVTEYEAPILRKND